ncbi:Uncharacterised protein [uncultured archaeon]|nr:Uncharacterised protein [uncultured archaeon]
MELFLYKVLKVAAASLKMILLMTLIAAFALPQLSDAMNLGTLQKQSSADIGAGETAVFHILFWNAQDQEYSVKISDSKMPQGWTVIVNPKQFLLNSTPAGNTERIYLPGAKNTVIAEVADIYVIVPKNESIGNYIVSIMAAAGNGTGPGFLLMQERQFSFDVNVVRGFVQKPAEAADPRTILINTMPPISEQSAEYNASSNTERTQEENRYGRFAVYLFAGVIIIILAWRVYLHD